MNDKIIPSNTAFVKTKLRKIGNSVGYIIPASIVQATGLEAGDELKLSVFDGKILSQPVKKTYHYALKDLLEKCDTTAKIDSDLATWDSMPSVGLENDF